MDKNNKNVLDKKLKEVKEEISQLLGKIKTSMKDTPEENKSVLIKFKSALDEMDRYSKEKWNILHDEFNDLVANSADQLQKQKVYLSEWLEKTKESFSEFHPEKDTGEVEATIDNPEEVKNFINSSLSGICLNQEKPFESILTMTAEEKEKLALAIEMIRRLDSGVDDSFRKYLYTVESLNDLKTEAC